MLVAPNDCGAAVNIIHAIQRVLHPARRVFLTRVNTGRTNSVGRVYRLMRPACNVVASINRRRLRAFNDISGVLTAGFRLTSTVPTSNAIFLG